jgi:tetratricopeptide (TPR) repeat protein
VLEALRKLAPTIQSKLGESLTSVEKFDTPLEQATTPSLEALQAFSLGWKTHLRGDEPAAIPFLERAISLDPNFAMAYSVLGNSYSLLGETRLAAENLTKAYERRNRASEREKFYIAARYDFIATGNLGKAIQDCQLWAQTYPRDAGPASDASSFYSWLGQYDKALAEAHKTLNLDLASGLNHATLAGVYVALDRLDEARAVLDQAQARKLDSPSLRFAEYQLDFLRNDAAGMAQQVAWAMGKPGVEEWRLDYESGTAPIPANLPRPAT